MTDRTCACGEPLHDQVTICQRCESQTRHHLADQAAHLRELVTTLTRQVRMNAANDGGKASPNLLWAGMGDRYLDQLTDELLRQVRDTMPPARPAADAIHSQRSLLVSWTRLVVEEGMASGYPANTVPAMACFIEAHLKELRKHECATELVAEMRQLHGQIMRAIDTPEDATRFFVGPCPETGLDDEGMCDGEVWAYIPRDPDARPKMRCKQCRAEWTGEHWASVGDRIMKRKRDEERTKRLMHAIFGQSA